MRFETINDVINELNKKRDFPKNYETFGEVVEEIISMGNSDKVYAFYDEHLDLEIDIGDDLMTSSIDDIDIEANSDEVERFLEVSTEVIKLYNRELTEDDIEEIKEDKMYRGEDPDELDI